MKTTLKFILSLSCASACGVSLSAAGDVTVENPCCRLVISGDGYAKSLVEKSTGEELLAKGARTPFATLVQNRPYDNEFKLMLPAKPWTHRANSVTRRGDELFISFEDEFHVAVVKIREEADFLGFELERIDYRFEDFGDKRKTEIDALRLLRLPLRRLAKFGRCLNATHDDRVAAAVMAGRCETRVDAEEREDGGLLFWAGTEKVPGVMNFSAVLVVTAKPKFLDAVDSMERAYGLPLGVAGRRRADVAEACYFVTSPDKTDMDREIAQAKRGGFRLMMLDLKPLLASCVSCELKPDLPGGKDFLKTVDAKCRAAGLALAIHHYPFKGDVQDFLPGEDISRYGRVATLVLAADASADATELRVEGNRNLLRLEKGRTLVRVEDELLLFGEAGEPDARNAFTLKGCARGVYNTKASAHRRGAVACHLDVDDWPTWLRYGQDTSIQAETAENIARRWAELKSTRLYYDGAEDVQDPYWYYVPKAQLEVYRRLNPAPHGCQSALKSHFGWHINTRGNAFDLFPPERLRPSMKKYVLRGAAQDAEDFTCVDLGWFRLTPPKRERPKPRKIDDGTQFHRTDVDLGIGVQPDHVEYVFAKALAWNCPVTIQFDGKVAEHPLFDDLLEIIRRWQAVRRSGKVSEEMKARMRDPDREFILLNDDPEHPEIAECRMVTSDEERPYRALEYASDGARRIVHWHLFERDFKPDPRFGANECGRLGHRRVTVAPVRRREITVSVIGLARPPFDPVAESVPKVVDYWIRGMDREIDNRPDLIILPEACDTMWTSNGVDKANWVRLRGNRVRDAVARYAAAHNCYIVYSAHRILPDGRFANSSELIDRQGRSVAIYDKAFPMVEEMENPEFPIVPGRGAVVAETDFGRVGFAICFDLNFSELRADLARKNPDLICFSSAFDGGYLQQMLARDCCAHVVSSTCGPSVPKRVTGPAGGELHRESYYMPTFTTRINTNCQVVHIDGNGLKFPAIRAKYGPRVTIRNPGTVGTVTLLSNDPDLPVEAVVREFDLEPLDDYLARARAAGAKWGDR